MVGRLKPGISEAQAEAELKTLTAQLAKDYPENAGRGVRPVRSPACSCRRSANRRLGFRRHPHRRRRARAAARLREPRESAPRPRDRAAERNRRAAGDRRQPETARPAIAHRKPAHLARWRALRRRASLRSSTHAVRNLRLPTEITLLFDLRIDWRVLTFTLVLSIATGILFSLIPALQSSKPQLVPALKDESSMAGFRRSRLRNSLVIAQVSLSLVLLISAALIVRGLQAAQKMRPGFNPENRVALSFDLPLQGYDEARGRAFYDQVLNGRARCRRSKTVAMTDNLPLGLNYNSDADLRRRRRVHQREQSPASPIPIASGAGLFRGHGNSAPRPRFPDGRRQGREPRRGRERNVRAPLLCRAGSDRQALQLPRAGKSVLGDHRRRAGREIQLFGEDPKPLFISRSSATTRAATRSSRATAAMPAPRCGP